MLISRFSNENIERLIESAEREYSIIFPTEYATFLSKYNGGYTPKTSFKANGISSDLKGFYGLGDVKMSADRKDITHFIDKKCFPIAIDSFGNSILLGVFKENLGEVFFSDHEKGGELIRVAASLKEFLRACKSEIVSEASKRSIEEREEALIAKGRGHIITDELRKMWHAEIDKYSDIVQEEVNI